MKLLQALLIIISLLIPFISIGKQTKNSIPEISLAFSSLSEVLLTVPGIISVGNHQDRYVVNEKLIDFNLKKAIGLYLYRQANSRHFLPRNAKPNPDHPRPKVRKKISKRKARKAKIS